MKRNVSEKARRLAYYFSQGFDQSEAASKAFPDETVDASRLLKRAEEEEILRTVIDPGKFPGNELTHLREEIHHLPCRDLEGKLSDISGGVLRQVWLFHSGDRSTDPGRRLFRFAGNAAWWVKDRLNLLQSGTVAVAFGATIAAIIRAVVRDSIGSPIYANGKAVTVVPTMGDPLGEVPKEHSATAIAQLLSRAFPEPLPMPSLDGVPAVLPMSIEDRLVESFRDLLYRKLTSYASIFGATANSPDALIRSADVILTSAGHFHSPYWKDFGSKGLSPAEMAHQKEIIALAEGDIAGVLTAKRGLPDLELARFKSIMLHWMGISMEDISRVARRAASQDHNAPAGCVLCCIGKKADIVKHLIAEEQVINYLLCDQELFDDLVRIV